MNKSYHSLFSKTVTPNTTVTFGVEPDALTQSQTMYAGSRQYLLGGSLVTQDGLIDRYLFGGGRLLSDKYSQITYYT